MAELQPLAIPDVKLVKPRVHRDARGFFVERWREDLGLGRGFVQDNHSRSQRGTLRGLHYQLASHAQGKLVGVTRGEILDVAVDLRRSSPTFGRWVSAILNDDNLHQLWIPAGFAHGFLVLSEVVDVLYKVDSPYAPEFEAGVRWNDPSLAIDWQLSALDATSSEPLLSARDTTLPLLADADLNFTFEREDVP